MAPVFLASLGQSIRSLRRHRGLTQRELASLAGVTRRKVVEIEQGAPRVVIESYARVIGALGGELSITPARRPTLEEVREMFPNDDRTD